MTHPPARSRVVPWSELRHTSGLIVERFVFDCTLSQRNNNLPPGYVASGQYFDQHWSTQRGLHGTAAAIRVLGAEAVRVEIRPLVQGLVRYVEHRETIEINITDQGIGQRSLWDLKLKRDADHTIKMAEVLYALTFVPSGVIATESLRANLAARLIGSSKMGGWSYVLTGNAEPEVLPTAHAVRALAQDGHDVGAASKWLQSRLEQDIDPARLDLRYVSTFALLVLVESNLVDDGFSRRVFDSLWKKLRPELDASREVNLDFLDRSDRPNYVRVPWQLHLISLAARLRPLSVYPRALIQDRLGEAVSAVRSDAFRYEQSGLNVSTRTYGILYDTIASISGSGVARSTLGANVGAVLRLAERPLTLSRPMARLIAGGAALALGVTAIISWALSGDFRAAALGPELAAAGVLAGLSFALSRPRR